MYCPSSAQCCCTTAPITAIAAMFPAWYSVRWSTLRSGSRLGTPIVLREPASAYIVMSVAFQSR